MPFVTKDLVSWKRATGDTCDLVGSSKDRGITLEKFMDTTNATIPSYWITSVGFFFGYAVSNIVDSFNHPGSEGASDVAIERRNHHSMFIAINISVFFLLIIGTRVWFMKGCDGLGSVGLILSYLIAGGAFWLGYGMYDMSKACGARSTDLFGVLSQLLPESAGAKNPIVCKAE